MLEQSSEASDFLDMILIITTFDALSCIDEIKEESQITNTYLLLMDVIKVGLSKGRINARPCKGVLRVQIVAKCIVHSD